METIRLSKDGLMKIIDKTSGMSWQYKSNLVSELFATQKSITEGYFKSFDDIRSDK